MIEPFIGPEIGQRFQCRHRRYSPFRDEIRLDFSVIYAAIIEQADYLSVCMNDSVTFVTIKWGIKYAPNYVNILHDMVRRNLPQDFRFSFVCFTDDAAGLLPDIETCPLPLNLTGWWNKLYLFKHGVFADGERIFFLDLDTAITGDLSVFTTYNGTFAILRDFYRPNGLGSGVMLWRGGFGHDIWQTYEDAGRPDMSGRRSSLDRTLQGASRYFAGSFSRHDRELQRKGTSCATLPSARIVCFHG